VILLQALDALGFSLEEKCWCFEACAAVLHLGNISFAAQGEGSRIDANGEQPLHSAAHFLKVEPAALAAALTERTIEVS
jgi:myosin heavy chain 1/2/3/4/8/13/7B/15